MEGALDPAPDAVRDRVTTLFSPDFVYRLMASAPSNPRQKILRIEVVLLAMLHFVVGNLRTLLTLLDRLRFGQIPGVHDLTVSSAAFYKRLKVISHEIFLGLLRNVVTELRANQKHTRAFVQQMAPFATGIYAIDDTTLDALLRRTVTLAKFAKGATETLAGRLGCALDLVTGKFAEVIYDPDAAANEKTHILPLVERLSAGSMLVFDLGYFSFPLFDELTDRYCYFLTRMRNKTSFVVDKVLHDGPNYRDRIVFLGKHRSDQARHPVRLVELRMKGRWWSYVTNVLDPLMLPPAQVWALYAQRWSIETTFAVVKRALGMAFLRLSHTNGVLIQIWSTLIVYQVLQDLRLEIAAAAGWNEDDVSWLMLVQRIASYPAVVGAPSLREWLTANPERLFLKKRGTNKHRPPKLPSEALNASHAPSLADDLHTIHPRKGRHHRHYPKKSTGVVVVAGIG